MDSNLIIRIVEVFGEKIANAIRASNETVLHYGDEIALMAFDGSFVMVNAHRENHLYAPLDHSDSLEMFKIVYSRDFYVTRKNIPVHYEDQVAFMKVHSRKFVGAQLDRASELTANVALVQEWEMFELFSAQDNTVRRMDRKVCYGNSILLRAYNGKFVTFNRDSDRLLHASTYEPGIWERFIVINPDDMLS